MTGSEHPAIDYTDVETVLQYVQAERIAEAAEAAATQPFATLGACAHCGGTGRDLSTWHATQVPVLPTLSGADEAAVMRELWTLCEVFNGRRSPSHLTAPAHRVLRYVRAARPTYLRSTTPARLIRARITRPVDDAIEAAAVIHLAGRYRAVAARLHPEGAGWRLVSLRIG